MTASMAQAPAQPGALSRLYSGLLFAFSLGASLGVVFLMLLISADIALRYFLSAPIDGVIDIVSMMIVCCVFLQLGSTIGSGRLVRADFLYEGWTRNRPAFAATLDLVFHAAGALVLAIALRWLWNDFSDAHASREFVGAVGAYQIIVWPFKLAVVVGCTAAVVETARRAVLAGLLLARMRRDGILRDAVPIALFLAAVALFLFLNFGGAHAPVTIGFISLGALFVAVALGMPMAFALLTLSFVGVWLTRGNPVVAENALGLAASGAVRSFEFGVVALFIMMGMLLDKADVGRDAFRVAVHLLRRVRGGLGIATVLANAVFASITGSSIASAAVFSRIAVPPMVEGGYTRRFAVGVVTGSSVLGMLIPPSLLLIIYGLIAETSVGSLFIAAILPGLLLAGAFIALNVVLAVFFPRFVGTPERVDSDDMSLREMLLRLLPILVLIAAVMGGIYSGVFSPTEAGAVGALGALILGFVRRKLSLPTLKEVVLGTGYVSASILFLIIAANLYSRMLTLSTIPMEISSGIAALDLGFAGFLGIYLVILLLLGMILDSTSIMLIMLPIVLPIVTGFGGDLVWFGVVTTIAVEIGLLTPPFGISAFVVKSTLPPDFTTLGEVFTGAAPFVVAMLIVTIILMAFPAISLALL